MAEKKKKNKIEVFPVSWTDGKVNKYQALCGTNKKRIIGDPSPTTDGALKALSKEVRDWLAAVAEAREALDKEYPNLDEV